MLVWIECNLEKCLQYACEYTKQIKITDYIKYLHTAMLTDPVDCRKSHLVLPLIEKEFNRHCIVIICPRIQWNKTYQITGCIRHADNVWLIEAKDKLYQWIEIVTIFSTFRNTIDCQWYHCWWKAWWTKTIAIRMGYLR